MMRYSDLSADNLKYVELGGNEYIYRNLREESPPNDFANYKNSLHHHTPCAQQHHHHLEALHEPLPPTPYQRQQTPGGQQRSSLAAGDGEHCSSTPRPKSKSQQSNQFNGNGNGTVNGAATISYLRQRKDSVNSTQSCHFESTEPMLESGGNSKGIPVPTPAKNGSRRKNSIGCLNSLSSSPDSAGCYYCVSSPSVPPLDKSQSLPAQASIKSFDAVILSALRVPADELASQLTLLDFPIFAAIQPDELTSCAWTKKDKHLVTPNIVAFTKRFNHTSFWTVQEILGGEVPKQRAEILTHFIKVAKKLHELNNLHSLFAIISALQSASIFRLKKTWACLSKKDRQSFERLSDIFSDQNNWENLRHYLESLRLPCIPYLGLFLTDLIYIDLAHPHKGGLEPEQRRNKMNNILRVIANYQQSNYSYIQPIEETKRYLQSIRYIEELQNIFEEDQYKKSLKLEPTSPSGPSSSSCSSKESFNADAITPALACLNLSPAKTLGSMRLSSGNKFIPGHRKCRSLGTKFRSTSLPRNLVERCQCSIIILAPGIGTISNKRCRCRIFGKIVQHADVGYGGAIEHHQPRHLLDDSVLEHHPHHPHHPLSLNLNSLNNGGDATSNESAEGVLYTSNELCYESSNVRSCIQGCVRRKTIQKEGRKPAVASWQRYWVQIWANSLVYFPPKSFKGSERNDFKREPCKVCPLDGWYAQLIENPKHKNTFELFHRTLGTVYKFRTDSPQASLIWINSICKVAGERNEPKPLPINLMSFE